jgi:hypothetical protein
MRRMLGRMKTIILHAEQKKKANILHSDSKNPGRLFEKSPSERLHEVYSCRLQMRLGNREIKRKKSCRYKMQSNTRATLQ